MTSDRDTFEPLSAPVERVIAEMERDIAKLAAEGRAIHDSAEALARKTDDLRRAGETKPEPREAAE